MSPPQRPRVLWVPYAQRGSLYPIVPAVQALGTLGTDIMLLGLRSLKPLADTLTTRFSAYESSISYDWSRADQRDQHGLGPVGGGGDWFHERVAAEYAEVERAVRWFRPDVLLVDSFVIGAGLAAEHLGVPWTSYVHYLFDESAETDAMHRVWWETAGTPEIEAYTGWWDGVRAVVGLGRELRSRCEAPWFRMSPHRTFLLGHPYLRRGTRPLPHFVTRTSLPPWDEPAPTAESAAADAISSGSRVLVANSSAWQEDVDLVHACLDGLANLDVEVLVTVSAEHTLGTEYPRNAKVLGYHPHTELLRSVDAVVTTAGYGITSKALWFGKPLVTVPRARDQHYVAAAAESAGCALTVDWPPKPDAVATAVDAVLTSPKVKEQARRLSGPMRDFLSASDVAHRVLSLARRR